MAIRDWITSPQPQTQPQVPSETPSEQSTLFLCNNDDCPCSWQGVDIKELRYACPKCEKPTRYNDLAEKTRAQMPTSNLASLWIYPVNCPEHNDILRPYCSVCTSRIDRDGNIPPVGIWGFTSAGKSVYCAVLMLEFVRRLFQLTGIMMDSLFKRKEYEKYVITPLKTRGIVPGKTPLGRHQSLSLKLYRDGWFRKKVTLTDMGGENFKQWFETDHLPPETWIRIEHVRRAKEAIFLMSPESSIGIGATVRDIYAITQGVMELLKERGFLASLSDSELKLFLVRLEGLLTDSRELFVEGDFEFLEVARRIARLVGREDDEDLIGTIDEEIVEIVEDLIPLSMDDQLDGLIRFLQFYSKPGPDNKFDLRLAITIGKSDLLPGLSLKDKEVASHFSSSAGVEKWRDALEELDQLNRSNNKREWQVALRNASNAAKQILIEFGEEQIVEKAEANFRDVGFFFVSSLGRDTEAFIQRDDDTPSLQMAGGTYSPMGGLTGAAPLQPTRSQPQWKLGKRVRTGRGLRRPEPQNVLWPLLWVLTGN